MSDAGLGHYKPAHEGHAKHEYEVFHVDFERVEIPFIIALWIFVSSLAKIGEYLTSKSEGTNSDKPPSNAGYKARQMKSVMITAKDMLR